ncbi:MAG: TolC family protein, partial [Pseudomonadota bacterium]
LDEAIGQLRISALRFQEVTRLDARGFRMPRLPSSHLPKTLKVAKARARRNSPVLAASRFRLAGARADAKTVRGAFLPQASVVANYERYESDDQLVSETDDASVFAKVRVPLYQQGKTSAQYRQAINTISQRQREAEAASHKIGRAVGEAWVSYRSAQSRVAARQRAVTASERAFRGLQEEHRLGTRSILDVLDAERDLIDARIALLETKRDAHVGAYLVLRSTGELTLAKFAPGADRYAPEEHYAKVKNKVWGTLPTGAANSRFLGGDPEDGGSVARFAKSAPRLGARPRDDRGGWSATVTRSTNRDGR